MEVATGFEPRPQWPPNPPVHTLPPRRPPITSIQVQKYNRRNAGSKEALFLDIKVTRGTASYAACVNAQKLLPQNVLTRFNGQRPSYDITRRFAHIKLMHEWISANLPEVRLPSLPSKLSTFFKSSAEESKRRANAIQAIFDGMLAHPLLRTAVFVDNFFENIPEVDPNVAPSFPASGSLYINVFEVINCNAMGPLTLKVWPGLSFWLGGAASSFLTSVIAPGDKIFAEFLSYERRSQDLCAFFQLFAGSGNTGVFAEVDLSRIVPYQMHDVTIPLLGSKAPQGAAMRVLVQFSPAVVLRPRSIRLNQARIHLHKQTWLPGDVLRGTVIFAAPRPVAIGSMELQLLCHQSVGWTHAQTTGYGNYATTTYWTISESLDLAQSRRRFAGNSDGTQSVLAPGWHCWPFEFLIPKDAPPTGVVPGDIVMHQNSNFTSWNLVFLPGVPGAISAQIPVYITQPARSKKEQNIACKKSLKWKNKLKAARKGDIESDDDDVDEAEDAQAAEDSPRDAGQKPRSTWSDSDGVIYEDWSQLPESLIIGNTYKFVYRVINKSPKEIRAIKIKFGSSMSFYAFKAPKDHDTGFGYCLKKVMVNSSQLIKPGQHADWAIDFTIPMTAIATSYDGLGSPMVSSANSVQIRCTFPGIWNWSFYQFGYHVSAPKVIPTILYTRPNSPKYPYRAGGPLRVVGTMEAPAEHPHIPFSYFSPYPAPKPEEQGRNPMRPIASWFFPLQAPASYPITPTNIILPPASDFSIETNLIPIKEPTVEKAVEALQQFAQRNPADAALCLILIAAIAQSAGQAFQSLETVQSSVDKIVFDQTLDATADTATLNSELMNRAGPGEAPSKKPTTETSPTALVASNAASSPPISSPEPNAQPTIAPTVPEPSTESVSAEPSVSPSDSSSKNPQDDETPAVEAAISDENTNKASAEKATVISAERSSMSLRQSIKLRSGLVTTTTGSNETSSSS